MQPLAQPKPGRERGQLLGGAVLRPVAEHTAQCHFLLLAAGVAGPVKLVQVAGVGEGFAAVGDVSGRFAPVALPGMKFHQQGDAAGHRGD